MKEKIALLGSTGSIGQSTLDVISQNRDRYNVIALAAKKNVDLMVKQCLDFKPRYAVLSDDNAAAKLKHLLQNEKTIVLSGNEQLNFLASLKEVDTVVAAIVGSIGALSTLTAANSGKRILLANKEALVMTGDLLMQSVKQNHAEIIPVDSEHNAIFQCLPANYRCGEIINGIEKIILTASGGPFLKTPICDLDKMTPEQAIAHPNWKMGNKVSIDSATMMNKALEVIEAHYLFQLKCDQISVLLHPQSIIHSLVHYVDGSQLAQCGLPDMRTPIASALAWPARIYSGVGHLNLAEIGQLTFAPLDRVRFPAIELAYWAISQGGTAGTILNAANEIFVDAFINEKISFTNITKLLQKLIKTCTIDHVNNWNDIVKIDRETRLTALSLVETIQHAHYA